MALIKCPNCGKEVSEKAFSCLYCGFTIGEIQKSVIEEELKPHIKQAKHLSLTEIEKKLNYNNIAIASIVLGCIF